MAELKQQCEQCGRPMPAPVTSAGRVCPDCAAGRRSAYEAPPPAPPAPPPLPESLPPVEPRAPARRPAQRPSPPARSSPTRRASRLSVWIAVAGGLALAIVAVWLVRISS